MTPAADAAKAIIAHHSKSFALASKLLPPVPRDRAVVVYAWCRRADDAVDDVGPAQAKIAASRLSAELDAIFSGASIDSSVPGADILKGFGHVAGETGMPRHYADELVAGMLMDADETVYEDWDALLLYCYRVAGTVGLMMSHVMGVANATALRHAVHLGMAMQLTNICRDVREDWDRGRLYIPDQLLAACGASDLRGDLGRPLPVSSKKPLAKAIGELLRVADSFYASGDQGLPALTPRCRWAVRAARDVYSAIGEEIRASGCDVFAPRAVVTSRRKLELVSRAALRLRLRPGSLRIETVSDLPVLEFSSAALEGTP